MTHFDFFVFASCLFPPCLCVVVMGARACVQVPSAPAAARPATFAGVAVFLVGPEGVLFYTP